MDESILMLVLFHLMSESPVVFSCIQSELWSAHVKDSYIQVVTSTSVEDKHYHRLG
jgi:hypothetical protein